MEVPSQIEVLDRTYLVEEKDLTESNYLGVSRYDKGTITLSEDMDAQLCASTLLHELIHCLLKGMGFNGSTDGLHTEHNVNILTNGLATLMRDEPDLFHSIIDNLGGRDEEEEEEWEEEGE